MTGEERRQHRRAIEELGARFIVVGSHGVARVRRALLGAVPHKLLEVAAIPVVVVGG